MTQPHEWKWDNRVAIMAGQKLVAVLGSEMSADDARKIESAPELLELAECLQAVCARIIEQHGPVQCGVDFAALGGSVNRVLARVAGDQP